MCKKTSFENPCVVRTTQKIDVRGVLDPRGSQLAGATQQEMALKKVFLKILFVFNSDINFAPSSVVGTVINAGDIVQLCMEAIVQDNSACTLPC